PQVRLATIARAQVWTATDIKSKDLKNGPETPDGFKPHQTVTCRYRDKPQNGRSPKFNCEISAEDEAKVKYGRDNGEVYAQVAATRCLWALGCPADRVYQVRVVCVGCPADPVRRGAAQGEQVVFD